MKSSLFLPLAALSLAAAPLIAQEPPPAREIEFLGASPAGHPLIRLHGSPGQYFALETSEDMTTWSELGRNTLTPKGTFDYEDIGAPGHAKRFYRWRSLIDPCFDCTQAIGFSQVGAAAGGWFVVGGAFESIVEDDKWQLLWNGGAGVDRWQDPAYTGWSNALVSPCPVGSASPDRVLLVVSGPFGSDEAAWATAIDATIETIKVKLPTAGRIILQPVVGGPGHATCIFPGTGAPIRASWQHAHIDNAIAAVVTQRFGTVPEVVTGFSPEVRACDDYVDATGHLTAAAAAAIGTTIGEYYAAIDAPCDTGGPGGPDTVTFNSIAAEDGWIEESSQGSGTGGTFNATATGQNALRAGDSAANVQNRIIISFDTSSLPAGATILSAKLRLLRGGGTGSDPFTWGGSFQVDIRNGAFNADASLQAADFQAIADALDVGQFSDPGGAGNRAEAPLTATGLAQVNRTGRTQFRLYFQVPTDGDGGNDRSGWWSGEGAAGDRPELVIDYE